MFIENNLLTGVRGSENDVPPPGFNAGGARYVCRFNTIVEYVGNGPLLCPRHGMEWKASRAAPGGSLLQHRGNRTPQDAMRYDGLNAGVGYYFSNSISAPGGGCNQFVGLDIPTFIKTAAPWGSCNGTGLYDQIPFTSTSACIDQPGSGEGTLLSGLTPILITLGVAGWPNPALDPVYEAGERMTSGGLGTPLAVASDGSQTRILANRDYYAEVSQSAQSSQSSPFNGTTGTGYGALANRPATCTPHVGYWATDQGNWNGSGSGGQGELYICTAANTWTMSYEPYTYPHPLTAGGTTGTGPAPNAPTDLTATVN